MRISSARLATIAVVCGMAAILTASSASAASTTASTGKAAATATTVNWGQDGFNKGSTSFNSFETAITPANVSSLTYQWSIVSPVIRGACSQQSPPIVDAGRLFVTDQGGFAAYNATTGAKLWTVREPGLAEENLTPLLAASGSTVVAVETDCISQSDPPSLMTAYNAATGAVLWTVESDPAIFTVVIDGNLVVTSGAPAEGAETAAYKLSDGSQVWTRDDAAAMIALSAGGRMLLMNFDGSGSTAVNLTTGATLWTTPKNWWEFASSSDGSKFFVSDASNVLEVNAATGAIIWTAHGFTAQCGNVVGCGFGAVDASHVYVFNGPTLTALNLSNGTVAWHYDGEIGGRPVVAGSVLYLPQTGSEMVLLNASSGAVIDNFSQYNGVIGHAVVVNGWLYVTNGRLLDAFKP